MTKIYYGPESNFSSQYEITPSPKVSISVQYSYANDSIIGYSYILSLNGYAMLNTNNSYRGVSRVLSSIKNIQKILSRNGGVLAILKNENEGPPILQAKGGILRSLSFDNSENNWTAYAPFTAEIEFNELDILDEEFTCSNIYINNSSHSSNLVDIKKFKIKEFTDSWNLSIEDESFNFHDTPLEINNSVMRLNYSISATGKNYFINNNLSPAWLQAKNFAQDRLYKKVRSIINSLKISGTSCSPSDSLSSIHSDGPGILGEIAESYNIFNETLTCETSESDGSFSLNYSALLKNNTSSNYTSPEIIHTINKAYNTSRNGNKNNITITVNGTIEGLCPGGIVQNLGNFILPSSGSLLQGGSSGVKITNAKSFLSNIIINDDLVEDLKNLLEINATSLEIPIEDCSDGSIKASSFNLTTNFMTGIIEYSCTYDSNKCVKKESNSTTSNIKIAVEEPADIIAEFIIPNGDFTIQKLGTVSAKRITVTADIIKPRECCPVSQGSVILDKIIQFKNTDMSAIFPEITFPDETLYTLTAKEYSHNPIDGTYNMTLSYICDKACNLLES